MKPRSKELESQLAAYSGAAKSLGAGSVLLDRVASWAAYGAATAAALAGATSASAATIVYSGPLNLIGGSVVFPIPGTNLNGFPQQINFGVNSLGVDLQNFNGWMNGSGGYVFRLAPGAGVTAAGGQYDRALRNSDWLTPGNGTGYAGFFLLNRIAHFQTVVTPHYFPGTGSTPPYTYNTTNRVFVSAEFVGYSGWLKLRVQDLNNDSIADQVTLLGYAYTEGAISAGEGLTADTPEPSTACMLLLASGSAGIVAWKRRRKAGV